MGCLDGAAGGYSTAGCGGGGGNSGGNPNQNPNGTSQGSIWDKVMGSTVQNYPAPYFDPLGYDKNGQMTGVTGAPEQRAAIFNRIDAVRPLLYAASDQATSRAFDAAKNPGFTAGANLANKSINGDFLNGSPQLDYLLGRTRAAGVRQMADSDAAIRSGFARNGMSFGTANQQAQQANNAASTARMNDTEAQTRFGNYAMERNNQNQGVNQLNEAVSSPLNYLSQVSSANLLPLQQIAGMTTAMTPGQQQQVDHVERDGYLRGLFKTVGAL